MYPDAHGKEISPLIRVREAYFANGLYPVFYPHFAQKAKYPCPVFSNKL